LVEALKRFNNVVIPSEVEEFLIIPFSSAEKLK